MNATLLKKIFTRYAVLAFILALVVPPLCVICAWSWHAFVPIGLQHSGPIALSLMALVSILAGWFWAAKAPLPDSLFARMMPLLLPPLLLPLAYIPGEPLVSSILLAGILFFVGFPCGCFYLTFLIRSEWRRRSVAKMRGLAWLLGITLACFAPAVTIYLIATHELIQPGGEASVGEEASIKRVFVGHGVDIGDYLPFSQNNRLARPASTPSLRIASKYPRLDGAIALLPAYAAFAQAVYTGLDEESAIEIVKCSNTVLAYSRLVDGEVDIFFGASPSPEQRDSAAAKGLTLTETPIGKEAFVFFVHKDNPVRSLTQAQIKAVYSGRIRNWKELGGPDERILAFQRPAGSGSQTTMLRLMAGETMIKPLREEQSEGMGDIIIGVAEYRNRHNAIGYSFRWYATVLFSSPDIRLLAVDGVEPTPENIRSGVYPFTVPVLAVTARPLSPQSKKLLDWILGPEGQNLLARVGYVPLH